MMPKVYERFKIMKKPQTDGGNAIAFKVTISTNAELGKDKDILSREARSK